VSLEEAFAKVVGRPPSEPERDRLHRLREALGLRDNDAFWSIVMALEYYDSFFRRYPAQLADETGRCIERARAAFAVAAESEAAHVQRALSEQVARTSVEMARKLAERPVGLDRITTMLAAVVAFGALCVSGGYALATPERPFWVTGRAGLPGLQRGLSMLLGVPAGWMIFALLLPGAAQGAKVGWRVAADPAADRRDQVLGGCLVAGCVLGSIACAMMLAKVT
jgi:hypothetical protein